MYKLNELQMTLKMLVRRC